MLIDTVVGSIASLNWSSIDRGMPMARHAPSAISVRIATRTAAATPSIVTATR